MSFINRVSECQKLFENKSNLYLTKTLLLGDCGIGKTALINKAFSNKKFIHIDTLNENYFDIILLEAIQSGLHNYLLNNYACNYKDLYFNKYGNVKVQDDTVLEFIKNITILKNSIELSMEEILVDYFVTQEIDYIILDNYQLCSKKDHGKILRILNYYQIKYPFQQSNIIFSFSDRSGYIYDNLIAICDMVIALEGLEKKYIEMILKEYFNNENMNIDKLSEYMYEKYSGNPGMIENLLKLKFDISNNKVYTEMEILRELRSPRFFNLDPTEERIMLFLAIAPFAVTREQIKRFLKVDIDYFNIESINTCIKKLDVLVDRDLAVNIEDNYTVDNVMRELYQNYSIGKNYLTHLIYTYQKKCQNILSNRENSDYLDFIINSKTIHITSNMIKSYFEHTIKTAKLFSKNEMWKESIKYYKRTLLYKDLLKEKHLSDMIKSFYYGAKYIDLKGFINDIDDHEFTTFEYWYWKGNLLYMLNDPCSISALDNAIKFSTNKSQKIYAQIVREESISELPEYCIQTLSYYNSLIEEYKNDEDRALSILYRNSLVLGGNKTISQCDKGIAIARKYNDEEELIKLNHNKHFELFRMGKYENCEKAFEDTANYFQYNSRRLYETAYGYNNLALLYLIYKKEPERARLYASSAVIYAGTPYSQITTQVNYNLIESYCDSDENKLKYRINRIENLLQKYSIKDYRIFRKTYFSIAISYWNIGNREEAIRYIRKSEPYLLTGKHLNRYRNLCLMLQIDPICCPDEEITNNDIYYNFYANPNVELWLLAFGHI